jgi:hypothetical protein
MPNPIGKTIDQLPAGLALAAGHKIPVLQAGLVRQVDASSFGTPAGSNGAVQYNASGSFGAMAGVSWDNTRRSLTITGATVTDNSAPAFFLSQTWNSIAQQILVNLSVTDTSSGSVSRLLNCDVGGNPVFSLRKDGAIIVGSWRATAIGATFGGTAQTTWSQGDILFASGTDTLTRRNIGSDNAVLTAVGGVPVWRAPTIHQRIVAANATLDLTDWGGHVYHPTSDTTARVVTIPAAVSVNFGIGAAITFVNDVGAGVLTIACGDTLVLSPDGTTGSRTLAAGGMATALKVATQRWVISGPGLT